MLRGTEIRLNGYDIDIDNLENDSVSAVSVVIDLEILAGRFHLA